MRQLTLIDQVYYRGCEVQPLEFRCASSVVISSDEQPYVRERQTVGNDWMELDFGWLAGKAGLVLLENLGKETLEVGVDGVDGVDGGAEVCPFAPLPPGQSFRFWVFSNYHYFIYARETEGKYTLRVFPK